MKSLRLFIVLVLAVLLPLRGAVGAALACPGQGLSGVPCVMVEPAAASHGEGAGHHGGHGGHHGSPEDGAQSAESGPHDQTPAHAADAAPSGPACGDLGVGCSFCASGCHAAALVPELPKLAGSDRVEAVDYPALVAPPPCFFSDGPERPPRSA